MVKIETTDAQNKVARLFTYLEKALSLDDTVVRDFRSITTPPSPWWLADLPDDVENLKIKQFDTDRSNNDAAPITDEGVWLRVEKKSIKSAPLLPKELEEWVEEINPIITPQAKEKIDRQVRFEQDGSRVTEFKRFRKEYKESAEIPDFIKDWVVVSPGKLPEAIEVQYKEDFWKDHPELQKLLFGYTKNDWEPWAEKVKKVYQANLLYDQLYALRLLLKNEGDNYELLLGQGLLTWRHSAVGTIYAPIFLTPLTIEFDAAKRVIEIFPDPMFRGFVETSPLYEMDSPAEMDLINWTDVINANPFDFWHLESLKVQSRTLINYVSTDSEDSFSNNPVSAPEITTVPTIWNAPVIFARKRNNDLWSKYASIIRRDIEQGDIEPTEFIKDLIGDYQERSTQNNQSNEAVIHESELFFPLPWNDEQKRIAERLDSNYGVVVKGPPGTGKSHTIANLISRFLAQGKTVLVTSQTSKALEVLRDKLPEDIRSLAVSQLNQTARRDDILQQSISEISSNLGERHTKFSEHKVELVRQELQSVREEEARLANLIRQYILTDSSVDLEINGESIKPIEAAKFIQKYQDSKELAWFTDQVNFNSVLNFSEDDLDECHTLLSELSLEDRKLYQYELPPVSVIPNGEAVLQSFVSFKDLSSKSQISTELFDSDSHRFKPEELSVVWEKLSKAKKVIASINIGYEQEIFDLCASSPNAQEKWRAGITKITEKINIIGKCNNTILGHKITGNTSLPFDSLLEAIYLLETKTKGGSKLSTFGKLLLSANTKKVLQSYLVDGHPPDSADRIKILQQNIVAKKAGQEIQTLLEQSFSDLKATPEILNNSFDSVQLEVLCDGLARIVNYTIDFSDIEDFCKQTQHLSDLSFTSPEDINKIIEVIASTVAKFELKELERLFSDWATAIEDFVGEEYHPIGQKLVSAIQKRSAGSWKGAIEELYLLYDNRRKAIRLNELSQRIKLAAPNLYSYLQELVDQRKKFDLPDNLELAWKIGRLHSWLDNIHDHVDIDELQRQLERLTKREYQLNSQLVAILAWQRQIDKVTKKQRDALMAWSHEMKKYGKGTGKYALTHLRSAQEALKEAKNAVPVWIMPLHRAAQMFSEPKPGMFDVVIFDEASQCDIRGLTIGYLGKKLLVVGDPEQISPAGIFQGQERIFELISRFLFDVPFKESFSITSSLFDLAKIRLSNIIQLNEHFRCVPEIIAFSNHHIYEGKLRPLRYPHPKGMLKPALVPVFVERGYQNINNKVNEPEAEAIVAKLVECLNDPHYQKRPDGKLCTFGIVSLLAVDQAKHIEKLIRNLVAKGDITEKEIEERRIECGDAYKFQGDERDVMLLSMVRALSPTDTNDTIAPLTNEDAKRRFNVAASRARDQMFLFHSMPIESLGNQNDWRYKLLSWFYDPKKEELQAGREALKKEFDSGRASQFSDDVGNMLIDRGYQVLPEYPVIGYRIDLVVQGTEARLAVECDGDQYHTLENWEEDQVREKQLRRAGWEFWRVTGSAFYRNKEKSLDTLWEKLDELGIQPIL